ncbi:MAG: CPBP family intramembrane glutamic endopeptidase, partial [Pseudomonadota bacterium]
LNTFRSLFLFVFFAIGLVIAMQLLHKRGILSATGLPGQLWRDFRTIIPWALAINLVLVLVAASPSDLGAIRSDVAFDRWLLLLPVFCVSLAIQSGTEELVFRGYVQQQIAVLSKAPLVWMVCPSLVFGLLHWSEGLGSFNWFIVLILACYGMAMADLTARTGSIGAAWAVHFSTNFFAVGVISMTDSLSGFALYTYPMDYASLGVTNVIEELLWIFILWLGARVALRV